MAEKWRAGEKRGMGRVEEWAELVWLPSGLENIHVLKTTSILYNTVKEQACFFCNASWWNYSVGGRRWALLPLLLRGLLWELLPTGETLLLWNVRPFKFKQARYPYIARAKGSRGQPTVPTPEQRTGRSSEPIKAPSVLSPRCVHGHTPPLTFPEVLVWKIFSFGLSADVTHRHKKAKTAFDNSR